MIGYGLISNGSYFYLRAENRKLKFQVEGSFIAKRSISSGSERLVPQDFIQRSLTETASKNPD